MFVCFFGFLTSSVISRTGPKRERLTILRAATHETELGDHEFYLGKCLTKCVVIKATVTETTSNHQETYIGLTENEFKTRLNLHKSFFKLEHNRTSTTLSEHVCKLKNKNIKFNIKWEVVKKVKPFTPCDKVFKLCLQEKLSILRSALSLNKRSEIFGHCIYRKKFLLSNTIVN